MTLYLQPDFELIPYTNFGIAQRRSQVVWRNRPRLRFTEKGDSNCLGCQAFLFDM
jgi:hypothetical protein